MIIQKVAFACGKRSL